MIYVWSRPLQDACDQLPSNLGRSSMVHDLVRSLGLMPNVSEPDISLGTRSALLRYHDAAYMDSLHGDDHDCPHFDALPTYVSLVAAATSTACRLLADGETDIAVNWDGGRHHAQRNQASGFCYVADIVLGIMLLAKRGRVLYLDLDLHFGDGVAKAFKFNRKVITLSVHHSSPVFFPQSELSAFSPADPYTLSIPLQAYPSAATYRRVFEECIQPVKEAFKPDFVVLQLGADGLPDDQIGQYGGWSVEREGGMDWCVQKVKDWKVPLCVLGGGGYNHPNTARAWASATGVLLGKPIHPDTPVPDHAQFAEYSPSFTMSVAPTYTPDENGDNLNGIADAIATILPRIN